MQMNLKAPIANAVGAFLFYPLRVVSLPFRREHELRCVTLSKNLCSARVSVRLSQATKKRFARFFFLRLVCA